MQYSSYAQCKEIAISISEKIEGSKVVYGLYFPSSPKELWDDRYPKSSDCFTHFWVETDLGYIDMARLQFGEQNATHIEKKNPRYVKSGELVGQETQDVVEFPRIEWATHSTTMNTTTVVWPDYWDYRKVLA